jgi:hypothetical protein
VIRLPGEFEVALISVDIEYDEVRELGLYMAHKYGNNLPKQYILLMAVAEVVHLVHVHACGCDLQEKALVEKSRVECDLAAIKLSKDIFGFMQEAEVNHGKSQIQ